MIDFLLDNGFTISSKSGGYTQYKKKLLEVDYSSRLGITTFRYSNMTIMSNMSIMTIESLESVLSCNYAIGNIFLNKKLLPLSNL